MTISYNDLIECIADFENRIKELEHELNIKNTALNIMVKKEIELKQEKDELIESFKELLDDAMYLYQYDPNNFRKIPEEYFKTEINLLNKLEKNK